MNLNIRGVSIVPRHIESVEVVETGPEFWCTRVRMVSGAEHDKPAPSKQEAETGRDLILRAILLAE